MGWSSRTCRESRRVSRVLGRVEVQRTKLDAGRDCELGVGASRQANKLSLGAGQAHLYPKDDKDVCRTSLAVPDVQDARNE